MINWIFEKFRIGLNDIFKRPLTQIPELDGLRSIAILLVVATHTGGAWQKLTQTQPMIIKLPFVSSGWIGVDLFFCLSGFFIGRQLWKEYLRTQTINPIKFVLRRGLRIWPLYYTIFILAMISKVVSNITFTWQGVWPDLFLLSNYFKGEVVGGSWSLSTEEQFYLIVPILILLVCKLVKKIEYAFWVVLSILVIPSLMRYITWSQLDLTLGTPQELTEKYLYSPLHTHFDGLIIGLLLANLDIQNKLKQKEGFFKGALFVGLALIASFIINKFSHVYFGYLSLTIFFGSLIFFFLYTRKNIFGKFLAMPLFYIISRLSFGMYLIHLFFVDDILNIYMKVFPQSLNPNLGYVLYFTIATLSTMLLSFITLALIELPFLELRKRLKL